MDAPKYVKFANTSQPGYPSCLRLTSLGGPDVYYRDDGDWFVNFRMDDEGKVFIDEPVDTSEGHHLHNLELKSCSKEEWQDDNYGVAE